MHFFHLHWYECVRIRHEADHNRKVRLQEFSEVKNFMRIYGYALNMLSCLIALDHALTYVSLENIIFFRRAFLSDEMKKVTSLHL